MRDSLLGRICNKSEGENIITVRCPLDICTFNNVQHSKTTDHSQHHLQRASLPSHSPTSHTPSLSSSSSLLVWKSTPSPFIQMLRSSLHATTCLYETPWLQLSIALPLRFPYLCQAPLTTTFLIHSASSVRHHPPIMSMPYSSQSSPKNSVTNLSTVSEANGSCGEGLEYSPEGSLAWSGLCFRTAIALRPLTVQKAP